jgi:FkbM family methyltransferase
VNSTFDVELKLKTVDQVIGPKKVSLMKVDCEGCEWAVIKGYDFVYLQSSTLSSILIFVS